MKPKTRGGPKQRHTRRAFFSVGARGRRLTSAGSSVELGSDLHELCQVLPNRIWRIGDRVAPGTSSTSTKPFGGGEKPAFLARTFDRGWSSDHIWSRPSFAFCRLNKGEPRPQANRLNKRIQLGRIVQQRAGGLGGIDVLARTLRRFIGGRCVRLGAFNQPCLAREHKMGLKVSTLVEL